MNAFPETRHSLIARIRDENDADAWEEFLGIYRPMIYRLARRRGWQDADAQDLTQSVLVKISGKIKMYDPTAKTKFRTWLSAVCQNTLIDEFRKRSSDLNHCADTRLSGVSFVPASDEMDLEERRAIFRWAARLVSQEFEAATWEAFRRTAIDGESSQSVAESLGISTGAIYTARSRVMQRLKQKVREYESM